MSCLMNNDQKNIGVCAWLKKNAEKIPFKTAVIDPHISLDYITLFKISNYIASNYIAADHAASGVSQNGASVCIFMDKSALCVAVMLGAALTGSFYSVIDTSLPVERIKLLVEKLGCKLIITDEKNNDHEAIKYISENKSDIAVIKIDNGIIEAAEENTGYLSSDINDKTPLYCNFTSGSTGEPKGVIISHRAVMDFIPEFTKALKLDENEVFANQAPFDFDVSVKDIYGSLYLGATLLLVPREYFINPAKLMDYLDENDATSLVWASGALIFLSVMRALDYKKPSKLRHIIYSGEVLARKHLKYLHDRLPGVKFSNVYGPTEITCNCTYYNLGEEDFLSDDIPIGKAFNGRRVFLLDDEDKEISKPYTEGEICVAGASICSGYLFGKKKKNGIFSDEPDIGYNESFGFLTEKKGVENVFYRTGDRAFFDVSGDLHFRGRADHQIKLLGHRIELLEIEKKAESIDGVVKSCCVFDKEKERISLFFESTEALDEEKIKPLEDFIRRELKKDLPAYMIPKKIIYMDKLPLNSHGKLDRKTLMK